MDRTQLRNQRRKLLSAAVGVSTVSYVAGCELAGGGLTSGNLVVPPFDELCAQLDAAALEQPRDAAAADAGPGDAGETPAEAGAARGEALNDYEILVEACRERVR